MHPQFETVPKIPRDMQLASSPIDTYPFDISPNVALPTAAATAAFATTLSLSTLFQHKILRLSTGSPAPIPSLIGFTTVALASITSHVVSVKAFDLTRKESSPWRRGWNGFGERDLFPVPFDFSMNANNVAHLLRVCTVGLLVYKGLGGRFWSIAPSSYTNLGSFARTSTSLPATEAYATQSQRKSIERLGKLFGCHTCGSRMIFSRSRKGVNFIADHMPPQSVTRQMNEQWYRRLFGFDVKQRFFPQCIHCSDRQGGILGKASSIGFQKGKLVLPRRKLPNLAQSGGGKNAYFHGFTLRKEFITGGVVAYATVSEAHDKNVLGNGGGNKKRFEEWEQRVNGVISNVFQWLKNI